MHLDRSEPLGPHTAGLVQILRARGEGQLYTRRGFALWRIAHHRLQARQVLLRMPPEADQYSWIEALNDTQPDLHITTDVFKISQFVAQAAKICELDDLLDTRITKGLVLLQDATDLITASKTWEATAACRTWSHRRIPNSLPTGIEPGIPEVLTDIRELRLYNDVWLAYMRNFHNASMLALHEAMIDVLTLLNGEYSSGEVIHTQNEIEEHQKSISDLSQGLLETFPQLLGLVNFAGNLEDIDPETRLHRAGKGVGGFFTLFAIWVMQRSKYVPKQHCDVAIAIYQWIKRQNAVK